jgi:hypothetical protein
MATCMATKKVDAQGRAGVPLFKWRKGGWQFQTWGQTPQEELEAREACADATTRIAVNTATARFGRAPIVEGPNVVDLRMRRLSMAQPRCLATDSHRVSCSKERLGLWSAQLPVPAPMRTGVVGQLQQCRAEGERSTWVSASLGSARPLRVSESGLVALSMLGCPPELSRRCPAHPRM